MESVVGATDLGGERCLICQSINYIFDGVSGELICLGCGAVIAEQRNNDIFTPESILFETGDTIKGNASLYATGAELSHNVGYGGDLSGTGHNIITTEMECMDYSRLGLMATRIYEGGEDCNGHRIEDSTIKRLANINKMTGDKYDSKKKNVGMAVNTIRKINEGVKIPGFIVEDVMNHYKKFLDMGHKGISPIFMSAAILYYTCQKNNHNISLQKISEMLKRYSLELSTRYFSNDNMKTTSLSTTTSNVMPSTNKDECQKKLYKTYTTFINLMELEQPSVVTYETMISEMSERLKMGDKLKVREVHIRLAKALGKKITDSSKVVFLGKSPKAVAVVLIYFILIRNSVDNVDIVNVSRETGISTVTIKKLFNDILVAMEKKKINYDKDIVSCL